MSRGRPPQIIRADGTKWCDFHHDWHPVADFQPRGKREDGAVLRYSPRCRVAEQTVRDRERELDPARVSIEKRAKDLATDLSKALGATVSFHFVMDELNWTAKVPILRALIGPGGRCDNCGVHHDDPSKYQLDHWQPALKTTDWAAQHGRNLWFLDGCNQKKGRRPGDRDWLDAQHRDWMAMRHWATHAGATDGWPPWEPLFGTPPGLIVATGPVDSLGNPTLF